MSIPPPYVLAAIVAAQTHIAGHHAATMSLIAKNARAIAIRAGDLALGFRPITLFIEEVAGKTTRSAHNINHLSIQIAHCAVQQSRIEDFCRRLQSVLDQNIHGNTALGLGLSAAREKQRALQLQAQSNMRELDRHLRDAITEIRAVSVIATAARVEAARASAYKEQLEQVAVSIDKVASEVRRQLQQAARLLH